MTSRNHLNEYYYAGGHVTYHDSPQCMSDAEVESAFCHKCNLVLFKDLASLIAYRNTHYDRDSERSFTYERQERDHSGHIYHYTVTVTTYTKVCYFSVQVEPYTLERTPVQHEEAVREHLRGSYDYVTVKPEKITHVNYAFLTDRPHQRKDWQRKINKKPYQLGLTVSTKPYETAWAKASGSMREKTLATLKKYKGHFLNRLFHTRTHAAEADALIKAISDSTLNTLEIHQLIKTALRKIHNRTDSDFAAMLAFLSAKISEYYDDHYAATIKQSLTSANIPDAITHLILDYTDVGYQLDQAIVKKASKNYEKYKNQFCGLRWWRTSDATKQVRVDLAKAKSDHERYKIAKQYIEGNRERAFAKELNKFMPRL